MFVTLCFIKHSISALLQQHEIQSKNQNTQRHNVVVVLKTCYKAQLTKEQSCSLTVHHCLLSHNAMCLAEKESLLCLGTNIFLWLLQHIYTFKSMKKVFTNVHAHVKKGGNVSFLSNAMETWSDGARSLDAEISRRTSLRHLRGMKVVKMSKKSLHLWSY